jgi:hypothetical protein
MRKIFFMCLLLIIMAQLTKAQTATVIGSVKDDKGNPLHYVFVLDAQAKSATYTDSLGNFSIATSAGSKLQFQHSGYKDATADAGGTALQIVLNSNGSPDTDKGTLSTRVSDGSNATNATMGNGGAIAPGHVKGDVHGNRYLFDNFAHGFIINSSGELMHDPGNLYNYDKIGGNVLVTADKQNIAQLGYDQIKAFTLFSDKDEQVSFEKASGIDNSHYLQVLSSGKKYKIYKFIQTKFVKSDYVNTGVSSHGNDYDEFQDDADYYVWDVQANQPVKFALKKKALKDGFPKEADKANKYVSDNSGKINDAYLSKLGAYMNQ